MPAGLVHLGGTPGLFLLSTSDTSGILDLVEEEGEHAGNARFCAGDLRESNSKITLLINRSNLASRQVLPDAYRIDKICH